DERDVGVDEGELVEDLPHPIGGGAARRDHDDRFAGTADEVLAVGPLLDIGGRATHLRTFIQLGRPESGGCFVGTGSDESNGWTVLESLGKTRSRLLGCGKGLSG